MTIEDNQGTEATRPVPRSRSHWIAGTYRRARRKAYFWFPNVIASPYTGDREYYDDRDLKENLLTRIPDGEVLSVQAMWGVEVFGPSEIDALYANLHRLGWDTRRTGHDFPGAAHWIREQRMYGSVGNYNIGVVTRKAEKRYLGTYHSAPMPDEAEYLLVSVHQLSASLTCVRIGFVLSEEAGSWYQQELTKDRKTTKVPMRTKGAINIYGVEHLKARGIDASRTRYRTLVTDWFKRELPGFFSNAKDGIRLPTAEFLTTEMEMCFLSAQREQQNESYLNWHRLVLNVSSTSAWTSASCQGLQLVMDEQVDDARFHSIIALRTTDVSDIQLKYHGGRVRTAFAAFCNDQIGGTLVAYASIAFLREADRTVKLTRERLRGSNEDKNVLEVLKNIECYFTDSIGQPAIARELLKESAHVGWYRHRCEEFTREDWPRDGEKSSLIDALCERTKQLAEKFIEDETASREQFEQLSSILNTRESVKTQKRMERLTIVALFVAVASLVAALISVLVALLPHSDLDAALNFLLRTFTR